MSVGNMSPLLAQKSRQACKGLQRQVQECWQCGLATQMTFLENKNKNWTVQLTKKEE